MESTITPKSNETPEEERSEEEASEEGEPMGGYSGARARALVLSITGPP